MVRYKFLDHTADVLFEAYGKDLNEVFENSALASFDVQVELKKVNANIKKRIKLENKDIGNLLYDFLEELIYLKDAESLVFSKFKVKITGNYILYADIEGEKINQNKHDLKVDVKAVTLHDFSLKKTKNGYKARILLDI